MQRKTDLSVEEYYHIYNRGVDKRQIFYTADDYKRFISLLYLCNSTKSIVIRDIKGDIFEFDREETIVDIGAYCLMPNHFHILIREKIENGISIFMKKILTSYSMYFNLLNKRTGALFEGRFKSIHASSDGYMHYLYAYIHLNPMKLFSNSWKQDVLKDLSGAKNFINKYTYSSYLDFAGEDRAEKKVLNHAVFPEYFSKNVDFQNFIDEWLRYNNTEMP